ncbi:ATP-binding protein [Amycolatopsis minnesotensis]|uniref:Histidine kinase/HSP90-like ATPase domain-containing protein n=1 Tax=Amycolatopsis minnesotensis TaxID=337894 RepID=A0ABP5BIA3_9PSEU
MATCETRFDFDLAAGHANSMPPLAQIRSWLRARLDGVARECAADAELLITEMVTNAHQHAAGVTAVRLCLPADRTRLRIEVDDSRPRLRPHRRPERVPEAVHGRGMVLIAAISTSWGVHTRRRHKTVWAEMPCHHRTTVLR